jgi:hypothetical protein
LLRECNSEKTGASRNLGDHEYGTTQFQSGIPRSLEVNPILTHDVIHDQSNWNVIHVVGESLADAVVHIDLPRNGDKSSLELGTPICGTHLSPFWKSTTDVGTKKP